MTGDDERRAETEALCFMSHRAMCSWYRDMSCSCGRDDAVAVLRSALDHVRRAPDPSSRDTETDAHLVAERAIDAYLAAIPSSRERDAGIEAAAHAWRVRHMWPEPERLGYAIDAYLNTTGLGAELATARARIEELEAQSKRCAGLLKVAHAVSDRRLRCAATAEARCEEIRAETIAEVYDWVVKFDTVTASHIWDVFGPGAAPPARNDEHGTENEG